ncbi:protein phosphatase 1 regulatory subunit 14A-like isoform X3 [Oncorhynchus masou masou]|uniref:protein phosphatase 1 regulatory subunit 14A-like isoform X3 n=1 Tax=Oncorhynchus masou masou TaxID=90313 RepID=UPI003183B586
MAANRVGRRCNNKVHSPSRGPGRDPGLSLQKRQARVTVKYNRKELQRRLDVEKWIDCSLDELYLGREEEMPEEVNIDGLLDLKSDEERTHRLQEMFHTCNNTESLLILEILQPGILGKPGTEVTNHDSTYSS